MPQALLKIALYACSLFDIYFSPIRLFFRPKENLSMLKVYLCFTSIYCVHIKQLQGHIHHNLLDYKNAKSLRGGWEL